MYKPPKPVTQKNPPLNCPSKYKPSPLPPGGCTRKIALKYKVKQSKKVNLLLTIKLAQSILKRKFPSVDKPLRILASQKGPLKNISPGAYFRNSTVAISEDSFLYSIQSPRRLLNTVRTDQL